MATNSKVFVSPGVYTSERDLSFVAQSVGVTTLGIVGESLKGPAFEPIFITNYDEFQTYFGGTSPEKFINTQIPKYEASYIAKSYLQQSNQMFMTRILGLSGYDAGPSWSIQTIANVDSSTVGFDETCTSIPNLVTSACDLSCTAKTISFDVNFTGCANSDGTITFLNSFAPEIQSIINKSYTKFNGGTSSLDSDIKSQLLTIFNTPSLSATSINYFGAVPGYAYDLLYTAFTDSNNVFDVEDVNGDMCDFSSPLNDSWYYALFTNYSGESYSGYSFISTVSELMMLPKPVTTTTTTTSPTTTTTTYNPCNTPIPVPVPTPTPVPINVDCFSGKLSCTLFYLTGETYSEYNHLVVATLRSRGISEFNSTQHGPKYEVSQLSAVTLDFSGSYSAVTQNPFATFAINITNDDSTSFVFKTSLSSSDSTYLPKVFGSDNFGKPRAEVPLFVEETFDTLLSWAYKKGYIRGLRSTLIGLESAREAAGMGDSSSIAYYAERYQTPESPWLVSELRGNKVYRLFKFISIADGNSANFQIKLSIINLSFNNSTFDVVVRDFYDTDDAPVVLEKFTNCSMDPSLNNFVAKKIGSSDSEYSLNSKFIMVEMNEDAPVDSLPCGFEGYNFRKYDGIKSPFPIYKTKYDYPGEQIFNPPFGYTNGGIGDNPSLSSGDNVRRTYLGLSNSVDAGYDSDFFQYFGKQNLNTIENPALQDWDYFTKGFHMDSGACAIHTTNMTQAFDCGAAEFRSEPTNQSNPYYRLYARKFTLFVAGGFDGWDVYREYRTNGDRYQLGDSGYLGGAAPDDKYPNATGDGLFRQITVGDNSIDWANTDYYAYLLGQRTYVNPEAVNINVFVTPGIDYVNHSNLVESAVEMIEYNRADSLYVCTTPDFNMFVPTTTGSDFIYTQEAVDNLEQTGIDSNYTATYYPWVLTRDTVNNTQIYLPPTGEVCRNLALTDNIAFPWFASAGYTRGLVNAVKARRKLTQEDRDTLYVGRINPIATFSDVGTVIWGNKTLQIRESALDRINVRRLLLQARKLISAVSVRLLFEQNDDKVRQDFLNAVNPILDAIRRDRGLYDFRVTVSSSPEDLDKNQLVGKIYIKPTRALEFIDIEFLITPTGASFDNI